MILEENVDYCMACNILFDSPLQGVYHYLTKALTYQDFDMARENPVYKDLVKTWLGPVYEKINFIRDEIMDRIMYQDMNPLKEALSEVTLEVDESQAFEGHDCGDLAPSYGNREHAMCPIGQCLINGEASVANKDCVEGTMV